jgi:hypothetical protein
MAVCGAALPFFPQSLSSRAWRRARIHLTDLTEVRSEPVRARFAYSRSEWGWHRSRSVSLRSGAAIPAPGVSPLVGSVLEVDVNAYKPLRFAVTRSGTVDTSIRTNPAAFRFMALRTTAASPTRSWPSSKVGHHRLTTTARSHQEGACEWRRLPRSLAECRRDGPIHAGSQSADVAVMRNRFQIDLSPGTWTARSLDGQICEPDIYMNEAGSWQVVQLAGRIAGCTPAK